MTYEQWNKQKTTYGIESIQANDPTHTSKCTMFKLKHGNEAVEAHQKSGDIIKRIYVSKKKNV